MVKPIIKWVGGKTQLIDKIFDLFPKEINNYYEPFIGGGSILLELLNRIELKQIKLNGNIYVYDLNKNLINMYKTIQLNPSGLLIEINKILKEYNKIEKLNISIENLNSGDKKKQKKKSKLLLST